MDDKIATATFQTVFNLAEVIDARAFVMLEYPSGERVWAGNGLLKKEFVDSGRILNCDDKEIPVTLTASPTPAPPSTTTLVLAAVEAGLGSSLPKTLRRRILKRVHRKHKQQMKRRMRQEGVVDDFDDMPDDEDVPELEGSGKEENSTKLATKPSKDSETTKSTTKPTTKPATVKPTMVKPTTSNPATAKHATAKPVTVKPSSTGFKTATPKSQTNGVGSKRTSQTYERPVIKKKPFLSPPPIATAAVAPTPEKSNLSAEKIEKTLMDEFDDW